MTLDLLIQHGADPRTRNINGMTALDMMRRRGVSDEIVNKLNEYETCHDDEEMFGVEDTEAIMLRQRHPGDVDRTSERQISGAVGEDNYEPGFDCDSTAVHHRLISDEARRHTSRHHGNSPDVFTIMGSACRRNRRHLGQDFRPISVFHEFFQSLDIKTLIILVLCIFCLALFAAFYVTGVHMNYFGDDDIRSGSISIEEASPEKHLDDPQVKIVPINI